MEWSGFDWDSGNWPKCGAHGVTRAQIEAVFERTDVLVIVDRAHSTDQEDRYMAVALDVEGHAGLFVGFAIRDRDGQRLIRPFTARFMHTKEAKRYGGI